MMRFSLLALLTSLLALGLATAGCAAGDRAADRDARPDPWSFGPATDAQGRVRSLTFDTDRHRELVAAQPWLSAPGSAALPGEAWYYDRQDRQPYVRAGYTSATVEVAHTFTRDRRHSHHGRVYDDIDSTTYRSRTTRSVR